MELSRDDLRSLTDRGSWERGRTYYLEDRVQSLVRDGHTVVASVEGQHLYRVRLTLLEDGIRGDCSCPMGVSGVFCKHCVAVGLALADGRRPAGTPASDSDEEPLVDLDRIRHQLSQMPRSALEEVLLDLALQDELTLRRLIAATAICSDPLDTKALKHTITTATRTGGFVDYDRAPEFARGLQQVGCDLGRLVAAGYAKAAIPLLEYALRRSEEALMSMDDSDGLMRPILDDLETLHHAACVAAKPDPVELARRIFAWELEDEWDVFYHAVRTYADVFGDRGLAEYRRLAASAWKETPDLGPGQDREAYVGRRFRLTAIMKALAMETGDLDELIEVLVHDLSTPYSYLEIANACNDAGDLDRAVTWAERGIEVFGVTRDERLIEFLLDAYPQLERDQDALELAWHRFKEHRDLKSYIGLKQQADRLGVWQERREEALALIPSGKRDTHRFGAGVPWRAGPVINYSPRVAVFLWENDADTAWQAALEEGCSLRQWLELARRREDQHPEDALTVRQDEVARLVNLTHNAAYEEAIEHVVEIGRLFRKKGQEERFREYVGALARDFKRKRNFMKLLDPYT